MDKLKVLELFSGTGSFSTVCQFRGHDAFTVDNDPIHEPELVADISEMNLNDLPQEWRNPDIVWASPPCQCFSVMAISRNWSKEGNVYTPKRPETIKAMETVKNAIKLIRALRPEYFFIENPRGMLRKMPFMLGMIRNTVTYCQYGFPYQKATDIWTNCENWEPKPICSRGSPCHQRAPRGSRQGLQGVDGYPGLRRVSLHPGDFGNESHRTPVARAVIPPALCEEIITACEVSHEYRKRYLDGAI